MEFLHKGFETLELSTQLVIREAETRACKVEVLDWKDNFIRLSKENRTEYVKQATRTSADSYITALIMENKEVTKTILAETGISVPSGKPYGSADEAVGDWDSWKKKTIVVKPKSSNFGDGITILEPDHKKEVFIQAAESAASFKSGFLVEEFVPGREFRFLVIGGKTRAVLHRVPANVTGDGISSVKELIRVKNLHPFRGEGYKTPLEKIVLGQTELDFLSSQDLSPDSVPGPGEQIFLRKNSNISTGGDSVDFTDEIPPVYFLIAEKAALAVKAQICGLDMIIPDIHAGGKNPSYSILELNFNPALHIHDYPWSGQNREVEKYVLDLLKF